MENSQFIQKIKTIIDERILEKLSTRDLAKEVGYSSDHMNRLFAKFTGKTLMDYVVRRKLQYALNDLRNENKKIIDIAMKYGFETHSGFTKAFKKHFGFPPSAYRSLSPSAL